MRISNNIMYEKFLLNIRSNVNSIYREQEKVGSGKRINRLSDDPVGNYKAMDLRDRIRLIEQYQKNANESETILTASETAVSGAQETAGRASDLVLQYANGTWTAEDRLNGAKEIQEIRNEIVNLANKKVGSRYIFGGYLTDAPPYTETLLIRTGVNDQIVFDAGSGDITVTLQPGVYTPEQLNQEVKTRLEAANGSADTYAVSFNYSTDKFEISNNTGNANSIILRWSDAGSTAASTLGFDAVDDSVPAGSSAVADNAVTFERGFVVTTSNNVFMADLGDGDGIAAVTLTANTYTPTELAAEIKTQLEAEDGDAGNTYSVTYNSTSQIFNITNDAGNNAVTFAWTNAGTTAGSLLGFSTDVTLNEGETAQSDTLVELSSRYVYQGDSGNIEIEVANGVSATINIPGDSVFDPILTAMDGFIASMNGNNITGINDSINNIRNGDQALLDARATIGARLNRIEQEGIRMDEEFVVVKASLSNIEDTDIVASVVEISKREASMEALRMTGFQMLSKSLFDFLR